MMSAVPPETCPSAASPPASSSALGHLPPLVVDLDGTLIRTDMLHESALAAFRDRPLDVLRMPAWLAQGKAVLKQRLARKFCFDAAGLPYAPDFLAWLHQQRGAGRRMVLCTASDESIALPIAAHLGIFDEVLASNGERNLAGAAKRQLLEERYGRHGFDYAGNSHADLKVWEGARMAIVVNAGASLVGAASARFRVERAFPPPQRGFTAARRVLRVHQWLKNVLLLIPMLASHQLTQPRLWGQLLLAFVAFSLSASSVYIANDLLDLESDRVHPRKRRRPFAAGTVPLWVGVALAPLLLLASVAVASTVGSGFRAALEWYFVLTCAYSWGLKRLVLIDCLTLALLYTLRVIAGAAAIQNALSFWLLAFSVFLFLSLAFVKRYAELHGQALDGRPKAHGRGYYTADAALVQMLGVASGYAAVMVLALYLDSEAVRLLYRTPELVWGTVPVVLYWISWMWVKAHRGEMHDDPLLFAIKDPASLAAGLMFAVFLLAGTLGWPA